MHPLPDPQSAIPTMKPFKLRFSLAALFLTTTWCALACAALVNANAWWWSSVFTLSFMSLIVSLCASVFAKGETRAFATGIVLASAAYGLHFALPHLVSDQLYRELYLPVPGRSSQQQMYFQLIWHTLWGAPYVLFGGSVARFIYRRFRTSATDPAQPANEYQPPANGSAA